MAVATADGAVSVRINPGILPMLVQRLSLSEFPSLSELLLSDYRPETAVRAPDHVAATWLNVVQRRIQNSIAPPNYTLENDGRWLRPEIGEAANAFFRATSDVLPSEPHIYSSLGGDLVAEFSASRGTMTTIISQMSVIAFAVIGGVPVERRFAPEPGANEAVRQELHRLTRMLRTGRHETQVESRD